MNREVRRTASAADSKPLAVSNSEESVEIAPLETARKNLKSAIQLLYSSKVEDDRYVGLVQDLVSRVKTKKIKLSLDEIERPQKIQLNENGIYLKLPIVKLLDADTGVDYVLNLLIQVSTNGRLARDERKEIVDLLKTSQRQEDGDQTISEDAILEIVQDLTIEERQELNRIQAERVAGEPEPEKAKELAPNAFDAEYFREISPRYTPENRVRNQAWQGKTAFNLDLGLSGGRDRLASVIAKMANTFLFIRSKELKDKSQIDGLRDVVIADLVNNLAVYIAVQKNADRAVHSKMLEAVSRLSEETLNPVFFREQSFAEFKQEFTRKLSAADFSSQRSRDFTKAIIGARDDAPLLTSAVGESVARIGLTSGGGSVAGYLGGTTSSSSSAATGPSRDISIHPLVSELSLFLTAIPSIEKIGQDLQRIDLQDLRSVQKIIPKEIFDNLDKALRLEEARDKLGDSDPLKELRPIEEYLKMLAVAIKHTPEYSQFLDKIGIKSPPIQFTISQILLAYYSQKNDGNLETIFREAINNLSSYDEFKDLNQFVDDQRSFVTRRIEESKAKDQETRINSIRQKRIGKPGSEDEPGSGRAGTLASIRRALKNRKPLKDLKLFDSNHPDDFRSSASGFLRRLGSLSEEDIQMLDSSLDEAKILMLYLVNGSKALTDLKLQSGLDGKPKAISLLDPSEDDPENQFKELKLDEIQKKFDKARVGVLRDFHPDRAATLFEDLTGKADEANSRILAKQCHDWLSKVDKIPEFGIGWQQGYFGQQLNDIYRFVNETDLIEHVASEAAVVEPSRAKKLLTRLSSLEDRQGVLHKVLGSLTRIISKFDSLEAEDKEQLAGHLKSLSA